MVINEELKTVYDTAKSFYKKAYIIYEANRVKLKSYNTIIAYIEKDQAYINGIYSKTSTRHTKEFLKQFGFNVKNTIQILKDYSVENIRLEYINNQLNMFN